MTIANFAGHSLANARGWTCDRCRCTAAFAAIARLMTWAWMELYWRDIEDDQYDPRTTESLLCWAIHQGLLRLEYPR